MSLIQNVIIHQERYKLKAISDFLARFEHLKKNATQKRKNKSYIE